MNDINVLTQFLGWCTVINSVFLVFTSIALTLFKQIIMKTHGKLLDIDTVELPKLYFKYLANYKLLIIGFNLVPYIALKLIS